MKHGTGFSSSERMNRHVRITQPVKIVLPETFDFRSRPRDGELWEGKSCFPPLPFTVNGLEEVACFSSIRSSKILALKLSLGKERHDGGRESGLGLLQSGEGKGEGELLCWLRKGEHLRGGGGGGSLDSSSS